MKSDLAFILSGRPYSGKGTIARALTEYAGRNYLYLRALSMGEALRSLPEAAKFTSTGNLADDELWARALKSALAQISGRPVLVLDGAARCPRQAELLRLILDKRGYRREQTHLIDLRISREESWRRYRLVREGKVVDRGVRDDEDDQTVEHRLDVYEVNYMNLLFTWESLGVSIHAVDGDQPPQEVVSQVVKILSDLLLVCAA